MDLLNLLKKDFKNILFDLLIIGRSFENLSYLSSCSLHKDEDSEEYAQRSTRHWIRPCLHNAFYGLEAYDVPSKK